ncbi:MAG TPA: gamma-glutamylcyclotransferase family protein [Terriglobales bacterium]|jgi:gamma-glutamylcyclotransferase (GGCT)/AIG2-like uncharacterized protein YtfP
MKRYLFSYGTLLPDHAPAEIAPVVRRLRRISRGKVKGQLYDLGDYPGAVLSKTGAVIVGQIFELPEDPEVLQKLDEYEGFDPAQPQASLFVRKKALVSVNNAKRVWCWVYVYNRHPGRSSAVVGGDFSKLRSNRPR